MSVRKKNGSRTSDAENRIVHVGTNVSYVYDGQGRRIRKTVNGTSVDLFYDLESHEIAEMNSPLVKEYYQTDTIEKAHMRSVDAVNSHCATCSNLSGAELSRYSRRMKAKLGKKDGD
jgi:YD repeat-containing protein